MHPLYELHVWYEKTWTMYVMYLLKSTPSPCSASFFHDLWQVIQTGLYIYKKLKGKPRFLTFCSRMTMFFKGLGLSSLPPCYSQVLLTQLHSSKSKLIVENLGTAFVYVRLSLWFKCLYNIKSWIWILFCNNRIISSKIQQFNIPTNFQSRNCQYLVYWAEHVMGIPNYLRC